MKIKTVIGLTFPAAIIFVLSPSYSFIINEIMLEKNDVIKRNNCASKEAYSLMLESRIQDIKAKEAEINSAKTFKARLKAKMQLACLDEEKRLLESLLD